MANSKIGALIPNYTGNILVVGRKATALATKLSNSAPAELSTVQRKRLRELHQAADAVDAVYSARERGSPTKLQAPRNTFANGWSAVYEALGAGARIPGAVSEHGARCGALRDLLFPDGVAFTRFEAVEAWTHGNRLLKRIDEEALQSSLDSLIGKDFFLTAQHATQSLGNAIGVGKAAITVPSTTALSEAVATFRAAVGAYARTLAADVNERDEESVARFLAAVAPIDELRSTRTTDDEEDEPVVDDTDPVTPTPTPNPNQ